MARRIDDALRALEQRVGSTVRIESTENEAIESTQNALAVLRGEWFEGLSEAMNVVPQRALLKLNLFRNSQGKLRGVTARELESTFCTAPYQTATTRTIGTFM